MWITVKLQLVQKLQLGRKIGMKLNIFFYTILIFATNVNLILSYPLLSHYSSTSRTQKLLERIGNSKGNYNTLRFLKLITIVANDIVKSREVIIVNVIDSTEEIIVWQILSKPSLHKRAVIANNSTDILEIETDCAEIIILNDSLRAKFKDLPWRSKLLFGTSLSKIITSYISYELDLIDSFKRELYLVGEGRNSVLEDLHTHLVRCKCALIAGLQTITVLEKGRTVCSNIIRAWFKNHANPESIGVELAYAMQVQETAIAKPSVVEDDIKYLRENLTVIIKSGMFMFFCLSIKIYICSFTFGVMITISSILWVLIYLQLLESTSQ